MSTMPRTLIEIDEDLCDGCAICVPSCHEGALRIIGGKARLVSEALCDGIGDCIGECPKGAIRRIQRSASPTVAQAEAGASLAQGRLPSWPVKIRLVSPDSPFLRDADLLVTADCVPAAFPGFHRECAPGRVVLIGCPKFEDREEMVRRLSGVLAKAQPRAIHVLIMQVPCCQGLFAAVAQAVEASGCTAPLGRLVIGIDGRILESAGPHAVPGGTTL